jgi:NADPH-dependent ferric siderophore reductase
VSHKQERPKLQRGASTHAKLGGKPIAYKVVHVTMLEPELMSFVLGNDDVKQRSKQNNKRPKHLQLICPDANTQDDWRDLVHDG